MDQLKSICSTLRSLVVSGAWILVMIIMTSMLIMSCSIGFKGISIAPTTETFYVDQFQNSAGNAPPEIGQEFSEALKLRVLNNSRLTLQDDSPDVEFSGAVTGYTVRSVAPDSNNDGDIASFSSNINRFTITVSVTYVNNHNDEDTWKKSSTFFEDFAPDQAFDQVEGELRERIFEQITTEIFNKAFTNW